MSLACKAAVELYYSEACASGCQGDIRRAFNDIRRGLDTSGTHGLSMIDVSGRYASTSDNFDFSSESVIHAELERYMIKVKDISLKNRAFLEAAADALVEKETLLYSDIKKLRGAADIVEVAV